MTMPNRLIADDVPTCRGPDLLQSLRQLPLAGTLLLAASAATAAAAGENPAAGQSWHVVDSLATAAEYVALVVLLATATVVFWRARKSRGLDSTSVLAAIAAVAMGELCLILAAPAPSLWTLSGHAFKTFAYLLLVRALRRSKESPRPSTGGQAYAAASGGSDALITTDSSGNIEYLSPAAQQLTGWGNEEVLAVPLLKVLNLVDKTSRETAQSPVEKCLKEGVCDSDAADYLVLIRRDGKEFAVKYSVAPVKDRAGRVTGAVLLLHSVMERKQFEAQLEHVAHRDPLTGLPNRILINDRLDLALAKARRNKRQVAVMLLDLDRFKTINDTLGHDRGDLLLKAVAGRVLSCLRGSDSLGRLGGDEFLVVLPDLSKVQDAVPIARKILAAVAETYVPGRQEFFITCSIGVSLYPDDGEDETILIEHADSAMYRAKEHGRNNCQFFGAAMNTMAAERLALEQTLGEALQRGELRVYYQPRLNMRGQINGVEALLRWQHPDFGLLTPAQFLPLAEESGLIVPINEWVIRTACAQAKTWQNAGHPRLNLAVNLSAREFREKELAGTLVKVLQETGLDPHCLELDLSESMLMQELHSPAVVLRELKALGVQLTIDDFGTGMSSLNHLKRFPLDRIKIDRSFIHGISANSDDARIVQAVIAMGHSMRIAVAAEGVETREQAEFLRERLCDEVQGSYFSEPILPGAFAQLLQEGRWIDPTRSEDD
jgi:diguanylate cyclase (GGDEF)-like protein/PAS domain S-box-containing protein